MYTSSCASCLLLLFWHHEVQLRTYIRPFIERFVALALMRTALRWLIIRTDSMVLVRASFHRSRSNL